MGLKKETSMYSMYTYISKYFIYIAPVEQNTLVDLQHNIILCYAFNNQTAGGLLSIMMFCY